MSRAFFCFWLVLSAATPWMLDSAFFANTMAAGSSLGWLLPRSPAAAFRWHQKAAVQGDAIAAFELGSAYYNGIGTPINSREAARWWRRGAALGNVNSQAMTGDAYCMGIGVIPDGNQARRWWALAERQGNLHAREMLQGKGCTGHPVSGPNERLPAI